MKSTTTNTNRSKKIKVLKLFILSIVFVMIAASVAIICFEYIGNRNFKESFYSVSSLKTNNKIRVIQISDLHNCTFGKDNSKIIDRVEKLNPDIIIFTGDIVDAGNNSVDKAVDLCASLAEIAPAFYIYGNNEVQMFYNNPLTQESLDEKFGFNDENRDPSKLYEISDTFAERLEENGVRVLKNQYETVTVGTTNVDIYGVLTSNPSSFWSYGGENFFDYLHANPNNLKITAMHEPFVYEEFTAETWGDVLICGHTHGGVANIPVLGRIYTHSAGLLPERSGHFVYGRYDVEGSPLIISSGLENKNPLRINNPPEITIIDINKF